MFRIKTRRSLTLYHPILSLTNPCLNWLTCNCRDLGICEISVQAPYPRPITFDTHQQGPSIGMVLFENRPSRSSGGGGAYSLTKSCLGSRALDQSLCLFSTESLLYYGAESPVLTWACLDLRYARLFTFWTSTGNFCCVFFSFLLTSICHFPS